MKTIDLVKLIKRLAITACGLAVCNSCGRQIETTNLEDRVISRPAATATPKIIFKIETINSNTGSQELTTVRSGWAEIPENPVIIRSISQLIYSTISFKYTHKVGEFICNYVSAKKEDYKVGEDPYQHKFLGCKEDVDLDGILDDLNYLPGDEIAVRDNEKIQFKIHSSDQSDNVIIESNIVVDWI